MDGFLEPVERLEALKIPVACFTLASILDEDHPSIGIEKIITD